MPTMYEIYDSFASEYDELVNPEDYQGNLKKMLNTLHDFTGQSVIEFGSGTGRTTKVYIEKVKKARCFDRSIHMLNKAKENLAPYLEKIILKELNHLDAYTIEEKADVVLEGWAFGHTLYDFPDTHHDIIHTLVRNCERLVNPGGIVILIETLGTNVDEPLAPGNLLSDFYSALENDYGYQKTVISTDYHFQTIAEAKRVMGFFFGDSMVKGIEERNSEIIPEYTGIWTKKIF